MTTSQFEKLEAALRAPVIEIRLVTGFVIREVYDYAAQNNWTKLGKDMWETPEGDAVHWMRPDPSWFFDAIAPGTAVRVYVVNGLPAGERKALEKAFAEWGADVQIVSTRG